MWVKANFHCHSEKSSDGEVPVESLCRWYANRGYGLLAVTDHNVITALDPSPDPRLSVVPRSVEIGNVAENILAIAVVDLPPPGRRPQEVIDHIQGGDGLAILAHPNWCWNHWTADDLMGLQRYVGIEIINTHMRECEGHEFALHLYDEVLMRGKRTWALGNDDAHNIRDERIIGQVWNEIQAEDTHVENLLRAIRAGDFYVSTGARIGSVTRGEGRLSVQCPEECRITFIVNGERVWSGTGQEATYTLRRGERYVRAEVESQRGSAYTQPAYREV